MRATDKEKADTLLRVIGVGEQLTALERDEQDTYNRRRAIGQIADQKTKYAKEQPFYPDAPNEPVSASELIRQQQEILARNGENQRLRREAAALEYQRGEITSRVDRLREQLMQAQAELAALEDRLQIARRSVADLHDESTAELEQNLTAIDEINRKVRANLDKQKAEDDAQTYNDQYTMLTARLEEIRKQKSDLLLGADLPLSELSVADGALSYRGHKWDCLSGSEQLRVATAIVRKLNPRCGFVLLDRLEQMDADTLRDFGAWLENEGLQAIATRVGAGDECSIVIEDGIVAGRPEPEAEPEAEPVTESVPKWRKGVF